MSSGEKDEEESKPSSQPLLIGDLISLKSIRDREGNLCASGVLDDDIMSSLNPQQFDQCVFQIVLQNQYSAARELQEYVDSLEAKEHEEQQAEMTTTQTSSGGRVSPSGEGEAITAEQESEKRQIQKFLKALEHGRDNEEELNRTYMQNRIGSEVKYGDIIQLKHLKSRKYVTVTTTETAIVERENLVVKLDAAGSALSWFTVMPRFKIDQEGDVIQNSSDVYFKATERSNEYLHCSEREGEHLGDGKKVSESLFVSSFVCLEFCLSRVCSSRVLFVSTFVHLEFVLSRVLFVSSLFVFLEFVSCQLLFSSLFV